jgi:hypothetical protein
MRGNSVHVCQCQLCKLGVEHSHKSMHQQMNLLMSCLDERQQRWFAALEANKIGFGGARFISQITGLDEAIIQRGQEELLDELYNLPIEPSRLVAVEEPSLPNKLSYY